LDLCAGLLYEHRFAMLIISGVTSGLSIKATSGVRGFLWGFYINIKVIKGIKGGGQVGKSKRNRWWKRGFTSRVSKMYFLECVSKVFSWVCLKNNFVECVKKSILFCVSKKYFLECVKKVFSFVCLKSIF